jgi:hypothetical protein
MADSGRRLRGLSSAALIARPTRRATARQGPADWAPKDLRAALSGPAWRRVEPVRHGEELTAPGVDHRCRSTHDRHRSAIRSQPGKTIRRRSRRTLTDDHVLLPVPAECTPEFVKLLRHVVQDQHCWLGHRRSPYPRPGAVEGTEPRLLNLPAQLRNATHASFSHYGTIAGSRVRCDHQQKPLQNGSAVEIQGVCQCRSRIELRQGYIRPDLQTWSL